MYLAMFQAKRREEEISPPHDEKLTATENSPFVPILMTHPLKASHYDFQTLLIYLDAIINKYVTEQHRLNSNIELTF